MSDRTLVIAPSGLPEHRGKPWVLALRRHDLGGVDYEHLMYLSDDLAMEIELVGNPKITWLHPPDWDKREKDKAMERARVLREEARQIEEKYK